MLIFKYFAKRENCNYFNNEFAWSKSIARIIKINTQSGSSDYKKEDSTDILSMCHGYKVLLPYTVAALQPTFTTRNDSKAAASDIQTKIGVYSLLKRNVLHISLLFASSWVYLRQLDCEQHKYCKNKNDKKNNIWRQYKTYNIANSFIMLHH